MSALLQVQGIGKRFGGVQALGDISFDVPAGGVFGLMGANGAGKTTLFNIISGALKSDAGKIRFQGADVTGQLPSALCRLGIARTFQIARPFPELTTFETIRIGVLVRLKSMREATRQAEEVLERFALTAKREVLGRDLTVLERKRLELARAYATGPRLLLLDEVAAGLRPAEVGSLVEIVRGIAAENITVLMIEHVLAAILPLAHRIVVLDQGRKVTEGSPAEITSHPEVVAAYLGAGYAAA